MKQLDLFQPSGIAPLMVAYGMGVDSTALLVGLAEKGLRPDAILFADTGSEKPETYAYGRDIMSGWLRSVGFPPITHVTYQPKNFKHWPPYASLEENCLTNSTLPSLAFGFKSCSQKWKIAPQDKWTKGWKPALQSWEEGVKVRKMIGYDDGPSDIRRRNKAKLREDPLFSYEYPLQVDKWDRERCKDIIRSAGLPVPAKSACYFCPATQPHELHVMPPDLLRRIVMIEARAKPKMNTVEGLWRSTSKKRPGSMTEYIRSHRLLDPDEVDALALLTPTQPIHAGQIPDWQSFLTDTTSACQACTACAAA